MYTLNITSDRGLLEVNWSNVDLLGKYAAAQAGCYASNIDNKQNILDLHNANFARWHEYCWKQREQLSTYEIPDGARILDVGCGVAVVDLLLYSYIPDSKIFLLDKPGTWETTIRPTKVSYTDEHPFYHSWEPITDAIETSKFDKTRFTFLEPDDNFPEDMDLILSSFSWCFHYPKEVYWDKVINSLKKNGKLYLDVRILPDKDIINEISEALKSDPKILEVPKLPKHLDSFDNNRPDITSFRCLWVKNI